MKALMTQPMQAGSLRVEEIREPSPGDGDLLVEALALGVCGTDREILEGAYGAPPPGHKRLVIGHESLGVVREAPPGSPLPAGSLVAPFVRMPDPVPCACCAAGEWDRCRNDLFTEHGIKSLDGFGRERYRVPSTHVLRVDPRLGLLGVLVEPASVVAKAWAEIDRLTRGACAPPRRVLVTGAGPVGLLAGLMGVQRHLDVHVYDLATEGIKPALVRDMGATYHAPPLDSLPRDFDVVIECTGAPPLVVDAPLRTANDGIVCLVGVAGRHSTTQVDAGALNDAIVLGNRIVFGSVNANRRHFELAHAALLAADPDWLTRLITRRVAFADAARAFEKADGDIKTVIVFDAAETVLA
jgi:threonine dehydrogenase-like Zn-dependent dehydrogenase